MTKYTLDRIMIQPGVNPKYADIKARLKVLADLDGRSLNDYILRVLLTHVQQKEKSNV